MTAAPEFLRALPKVQLHCHLEGTLRPDSFLDLAARHGVALTYRPGGEEAFAPSALPPGDRVYDFADFTAFLMTFAAVSRSLACPDDYARLAAEYLEDALAQNVIRAELFISPSVWRFFHPELNVRACVEAMRERFDAMRDRIDVALTVDVTRNFGAESAMRTAVLAAEMRDLGVIGIGLGGDEARFPAELFEGAFTFARKRGLHTVAHAGEAAGAQSVRAALDVLQVERIGHGIRALEDPRLVETLARRGVPLEICPTSNFRTGVVAAGDVHPLRDLDAAGCRIVIDADDPAIFRSSITDEYAYVENLMGREAVLRFARFAIDSSFADEAGKAAMHRLLEGHLQHVRT